jgi:hypothetical protein
MQMQHGFEAILEISRRVNWRIEDIIGGDKKLDFAKPFLPETFARTERLAFLAPSEKLTLNHIRARGYLATFELVEHFITPFITDQGLAPDEDPFRAPALEQFASEETKHMELFRRFLAEFDAEFGMECGFIGPAEDVSPAILAHSTLSVVIAVLGIEWMSQGHYVESVKDDQDLDPQFKSMLRHHWIEEAQHAKLDALLLQSMVKQCTPGEIDRAVNEYFEIGAFFDGGFKQQAALDLDAFKRASGRKLADEEQTQFLDVQHQALRWTFLGSAMSNRNFLAALAPLDADATARIANAAVAFS